MCISFLQLNNLNGDWKSRNIVLRLDNNLIDHDERRQNV